MGFKLPQASRIPRKGEQMLSCRNTPDEIHTDPEISLAQSNTYLNLELFLRQRVSADLLVVPDNKVPVGISWVRPVHQAKLAPSPDAGGWLN